MAKGNLRSFRYSDRVAELLEQQEGNSLNEKFENLVLFCFDRKPKVKKELAALQKMVDAKRKEYQNLCSRLQSMSSLIRTLEAIQRYGETAAQQIEGIKKGDL